MYEFKRLSPSVFHFSTLLEHRVEFVPVNGRGLYEIFRQYMDVIGGFRQVLMTHVFPQEREHCHKVLSIVQPAVQAGRGELVAEAVYPYFSQGASHQCPHATRPC